MTPRRVEASGIEKPTVSRAHVIRAEFMNAFVLVAIEASILPVARQSGWEHSDNQDGHFGGRGERIFVAAR
jgi:hypothetical protein